MWRWLHLCFSWREFVQAGSWLFESTLQLLRTISEQQANHRYAPGKWGIKEMVGHVVDAERVFVYRALCFARNDAGPFPAMEQNDYVENGNFGARTLVDIAEEFHLVRQSNLRLFQSFDEEISLRKGVASGFEFPVRALVYIIAGHEQHHVEILQERYLKKQFGIMKTKTEQFSNKINRRQFVQSATAAGAGLVLAPAILRESVYGQSNDLNVAIIGVGAQGQVLLSSCLKIPNLRFKAVCDIWEAYNLRRAHRLLKKYRHDPTPYEDYRDLLASEKDLDAVIIATPDFWHARHAIACLNAGLNVYLEKEMS
ncbi:MAG: DinB family protein, partial [bacterium]